MKKVLTLIILFFASLNAYSNEIALVLSGGGARAVAQVGVIEVLEEHGIRPNVIVGTSGGAIIGVMYADNPDATNLRQIASTLHQDNLVDVSYIRGLGSLLGFKTSMVDLTKGREYISGNMKAQKFHELDIPFISVVTDLDTGETIGIRDGHIAEAIIASCSVPGIFSHVEIDGKRYVDGGVTAPAGVEIAKDLNAKHIIVVDTILPAKLREASNSWDLFHRSHSLRFRKLNEYIVRDASVVIKPHIEDVGLFDYHRSEELIEIGRQAARKMIPEIRKQLSLVK